MSHGSFSSEYPQTQWLNGDNGNDPDRKMETMRDFVFTDPYDRRWHAPSNFKTDGASIPRAFWSVVGSPFTGYYRRASIIHDKACETAGDDPEARRAADRMWYHACRAGGCSTREATILYIGVRIGAHLRNVPHWSGAANDDNRGPMIDATSTDQRLQRDLRDIGIMVLEPGEVDDVETIERRTDFALSAVTDIDLKGR